MFVLDHLNIDMSDDVDSLVAQLQGNRPVARTSVQEVQVTKESAEQYVLDKVSRLVELGMSSAEEIKDCAVASQDPETIRAYAEVLKSTVQAVDTIAKFVQSEKKNKTSKELKIMDIEGKKQLVDHIRTPNEQPANKSFKMSRDELFNELFKQDPIPAIEVTEQPEQPVVGTN